MRGPGRVLLLTGGEGVWLGKVEFVVAFLWACEGARCRVLWRERVARSSVLVVSWFGLAMALLLNLWSALLDLPAGRRQVRWVIVGLQLLVRTLAAIAAVIGPAVAFVSALAVVDGASVALHMRG